MLVKELKQNNEKIVFKHYMLSVMESLRQLSQLETVSRQIFQCLGLSSILGP
jgi:hypothetical protein